VILTQSGKTGVGMSYALNIENITSEAKSSTPVLGSFGVIFSTYENIKSIEQFHKS